MALTAIENGVAEHIPQDETKATKVGLIKKELGKLDFTRPSEEICRYVRGLNPWPGTYTWLDGKQLRIFTAREAEAEKAEIEPGTEGGSADTCAEPGTVISTGKKSFDVMTGDGILSVLEVQLAGKKRMDAG